MVLASGETQFERVVSCIYQAALDRSAMEGVLVAASDYVGASGGMLVFKDVARQQGERSWTAVGRLRPDLAELYLKRHIPNPYSPKIAALSTGTVVSSNSLIPLSECARTELYADVWKPQGIRDVLVLQYPSWRRVSATGGFAFILDERGADDVERRQRRFARLAPHLMRALDLATAAGASGAVVQSLQALIDAAPLPAMLLDGAGRLRHANAQAEALLLESDGLGAGGRGADEGKRLHASRLSDSQRLTATIGRALLVASNLATGRQEETFSVRIGRPSGRPDLAVCAVPLPSSMAPWAGGPPPYVAVYVLQPGHVDGESFAQAAVQLGALYNLTAAEQRVAALVGAGSGLPGAARELGVSTETARTHLRRCFDKTGARSQVDLARLLARFPARRPTG